MVDLSQISKMEFRQVFDCAFLVLTTSTEKTASDRSAFNSASNCHSGIALKRAELGDIQGRTVTSDVTFHRFFI